MRVGRLVIGRSRRWRRRRRDRGGIGGGRRSQTEISPGQRLRRAEQTGTGSDDTLHQFRDDGFALSPIGECLQVGGHLHGHLPEKTGGGHHVATVKRLGMRHLGQIIGDGNDGIAFADTRVQARQPDGLAFAQVRRWREPRRPRSFTSRPGAEPSSVASRAARTGLYDVIARSSPVPVESSRYSRLTVHVVIATRWPWFVVVWRRPRSQTTASSCEKKEEKNNNVSVAGAIVTLERDVFSFEISLDDFLLYFEFIYIFSSLSMFITRGGPSVVSSVSPHRASSHSIHAIAVNRDARLLLYFSFLAALFASSFSLRARVCVYIKRTQQKKVNAHPIWFAFLSPFRWNCRMKSTELK